MIQRTVDDVAERAARGLTLESDVVTTPLIIRAGETIEIQFRLSFDWSGGRIPAVGAPVAFENPEWGVIVRAERVSGPTGTVSVTVQVADKRGPVEVCAHIDRAALAATPADRFTCFITDDSSRAVVQVQIIPERGVSVCLDLDSVDTGAAQQLAGAFSQALARYGCTLEECAPGTDIIVSGEFSTGVATSSVEGEQLLAVLNMEAFDQRTALTTARTTVSVEWPSREDRGEAEALALREVGRLLAVYLESRIVPD